MYGPLFDWSLFFPFSLSNYVLTLCLVWDKRKEKGKKISEKRRKRRDFPRLVERNLCKGNEKKRNLFSYLNLQFSFLPSWEKKPEVKI